MLHMPGLYLLQFPDPLQEAFVQLMATLGHSTPQWPNECAQEPFQVKDVIGAARLREPKHIAGKTIWL